MTWDYYRACTAVLDQARALEPARQINTCRCSALFLTPPGIPHADQCSPCFMRDRRQADEAADRHLYQRWLAGDVPDLVIAQPVHGERVEKVPAQMGLF